MSEHKNLFEIHELLTPSIQTLEKIFFSINYPDIDHEESWLDINFAPDQSGPHVQTELLALTQDPLRSTYVNHMKEFWKIISKTDQNIIFFCRERSPAANILFMLTGGGGDYIEDLATGALDDKHFELLVRTVRIVASKPLWICDVREHGTFLPTLFEIHDHFKVGLCDWQLCPQEQKAVTIITKHSELKLLTPAIHSSIEKNAQPVS